MLVLGESSGVLVLQDVTLVTFDCLKGAALQLKEGVLLRLFGLHPLELLKVVL